MATITSSPPIDTSLTIAGATADSKSTCDKIETVKSGLNAVLERLAVLEG